LNINFFKNMNKNESKERIEKLKKIINYHRYLYHVLNRQEISEEALDSLKHELYQLEQKFPEFITPDSPTQRVEGKPLKEFKKVLHKKLMISLEDIFSFNELKEWEEYLKRIFPREQFDYFAELKIDGFAISLIYKNGVFLRGATRGTGKIGEDVTQNLKTIESIPLKIEINGPISNSFVAEQIKKTLEEGEIEIRGEIYIEIKDFDKLNQELLKKGQSAFANPRNLAAGSIHQLDPKIVAERKLKFIAYDIASDLGLKTHLEKHQILSILGFKTDEGMFCKNLQEVFDFYKKVEKKRNELPFQIDGIVVNVNNNELFEKLGIVGKAPRGSRAFKFSPKQATTILENIRLQVGRTGAVTPVAILKPVTIEGITVSRATLHNEDQIAKLDARIGDTVIIGRAGDVIPEVIKVLPELRTGKEQKFQFPKDCPICGTELVKPQAQKVWRCPNSQCPARKRKYFYHFIEAFDIIGLGPRMIDKLLDLGLIFDASDLFRLKEEDFLLLEGVKEKLSKKIVKAINEKKEIVFSKFIYTLGIRNVGAETAIDLAEHFSSVENLAQASLSELEKINNIGPVVAQSIYTFFQSKKNLEFIEKLKKAGIKIIKEQKTENQKFKGINFLFTGELESMTREVAKEKIRELGGKPFETVSKKVNYVVVGRNPGSKYHQAKKLGIKIISEKEFLDLIA